MKLSLLHSYYGPNRRSDKLLVEAMLTYAPGEPAALADQWEGAVARARAGLETAFPGHGDAEELQAFPGDSPIERFARLFTGVALALQRHCGHPVRESGWEVDEDRQRITAWFEHDEAGVGSKAGLLALKLLGEAFAGMDWDLGDHSLDGRFGELAPGFEDHAAGLAEPADTRAIIAAAREQGVPVIRLERDPYTPVQGDFRIRMNGMLMLGHSAHRQVIDGTFALEKSAGAHPLVSSRAEVMRAALRMGLPVPASHRDFQPLASSLRAGRAARQLGFPLVVKTVTRGRPRGTTVHITDDAGLERAVDAALAFDQQFTIERHVQGHTWKLLVAGHEPVAVLKYDGAWKVFAGDVHPSVVESAVAASRQLGVGLLTLTVVAPDIRGDLASRGGVVTGMDVAPRLDELLGGESPLLTETAGRFVRWLVPEGAASRLPVISVTGTNGKTTTSRMIARIMQETGRVTGLQCTDGRYVNDRQTFKGDDASLTGHFCFYEDPSVELAVLECHHNGIATQGFAFERCDIAVCTNVTDDHIGHLGIDSVAEMAVVKRSLIERASDAVVLNADDPHVLAMAPFVNAGRTFLFSTEKSAADLAALPGDPCCCVLEQRDGRDWIVVHADGRCTDVVAVGEIPATFEGKAKFNVANAMAAVAASSAMGVTPEQARRAMSSFVMSREATPNRLNFYPGLPFRVLADFAHNPDGIRRLAEFIDAMDIPGRRILVFTATRTRDHTRRCWEAAAGRFDHYVVQAHTGQREQYRDDRPQDVAAFVTGVLERNGVAASRITTGLEEMDAVSHALDMAVEGDLVVLLLRSGAREGIDGFMRDYVARRAAGVT